MRRERFCRTAAAVLSVITIASIVTCICGTAGNEAGLSSDERRVAVEGAVPEPAKEPAIMGAANESTAAGSAATLTPQQVIVSLGEDARTVYISWKGDESRAQYIRYAEDGRKLPLAAAVKADRVKVLGGRYCRYSVELPGLEAGKKYYYEIGDGVSYGNASSFTAPGEDGETNFVYLGDVQFEDSTAEYSHWREMTEMIYRKNPDLELALIGGDMVNVPTEPEQWNAFLDSCGVFAKLPLMTVPGNHEGVNSNTIYAGLFRLPENGPHEPAFAGKDDFYTFEYGHCRFIMMDSSFLTAERQQTLGRARWSILENSVEKWLRRVLAENDSRWTIVTLHHPPYGMHDSETTSPQIRNRWVPIMEEGGVDLVLCGHQHMYMRTGKINGIVYVMGNSGSKRSEYYDGGNEPFYARSAYGEGANYQLISADRGSLQIVSCNEKGLVIDEARIDKNLRSHILEFLGRD